MQAERARALCAGIAALLIAIAPLACGREPSVRFEPTPPEIVDVMLQMGDVDADDILYDLGSGDGRIVIAAAKQHGARGVGVELDAGLIERARREAREAGVADRVQFIREDLFKTDFREATVVTLYLLPEANLRLRPRLLRELAPGTHIVSHSHDMGDWEPQEAREVRDRTGRVHRVYMWVIPSEAEVPPVTDDATGG